MILLQAIYFCTYWTFLCNITDISTIAHWRLYSLLKGALLSRFYLTLMTQSAFSVRLHLPFDILPVMMTVNGAKTRVSTGIFGAASTHWFTLYLYSLNTRFENTAFQFWLFFFTLWPLALVRFSVSHAYGCQRFCRVVFADGLLELKKVWWSSEWMLCPSSSQPFTSRVLHIDPVLLSILFSGGVDV